MYLLTHCNHLQMATLEVALELRCRRELVAFLDIGVMVVVVVMVPINVDTGELRTWVRVFMVMFDIHPGLVSLSLFSDTQDTGQREVECLENKKQRKRECQRQKRKRGEIQRGSTWKVFFGQVGANPRLFQR